MKRYSILAAALLLLFLVSACQNQEKASVGTDADSQVIAVVNGEKITQARFDRFMKMERFNYQMSVLGMLQEMPEQNLEADLMPEISPEIDKQLQDGLFQQMVNMVLINQEGDKRKISVKKEELDLSYNNMLQSKGQEAYNEWLQGTGLDDSDTKYILKTQLIYDKLASDIKKQIKISDEELKAYYDKNAAQQLEISHILMENEAEANEVLAQLKNGEDFASMARIYSICPSKEQGGALGAAATGKWVEPFEVAALKLQAGEMTEQPVKSEFGYHIIRADAAKPFAEVRNSLVLQLQNLKEQEAQESYLHNLRYNAEIIDNRS